MRAYTVADGIDLDFGATAAGDAIDVSSLEMPFQPGATVVAQLSVGAWAEAELVGASLKLQGSDNAFSGWEDLVVAGGVANAPVVVEEIVLPQYIRWAMASVTAGDGRGAIQLLSN